MLGNTNHSWEQKYKDSKAYAFISRVFFQAMYISLKQVPTLENLLKICCIAT